MSSRKRVPRGSKPESGSRFCGNERGESSIVGWAKSPVSLFKVSTARARFCPRGGKKPTAHAFVHPKFPRPRRLRLSFNRHRHPMTLHAFVSVMVDLEGRLGIGLDMSDRHRQSAYRTLRQMHRRYRIGHRAPLFVRRHPVWSTTYASNCREDTRLEYLSHVYPARPSVASGSAAWRAAARGLQTKGPATMDLRS